MNKLEVKLDQQVAVLQRQSESFKVHYLEGQRAAAQQANKASHQHQLLATQVNKNTEHEAEREHRVPPARAEGRLQGQLRED
jgi:hypothetical protein